MDLTNRSTSTTSWRTDRDYQRQSESLSLEQQYEEWKNDPQAQKEYQEWLEKDQQKRALLPDPLA